MKKKLLGLLMALLLLCSISVFAFAEVEVETLPPGYVTFTGERMVEERFNVDQIFDGLEPGDKRSYTVYVLNQYSKPTRWYMSNKVLESLEESAAAGEIIGGAYSYKLTWNDQTIYDSASNFVGGDYGFKGRTGLHEATSSLEDYFFLDTLDGGEGGVVTLTVSLEGETQGNTYQNTAAKIQMNFAVEKNDEKTAVKTGDENNLMPYYIGMVVAGLLFLYLALDAVTDRMYKKGRG